MSMSKSFVNPVARRTSGAGVIPVVVRFVPYDQWCITHIALSWTIAQVKTWILAKCFHDFDTLRILSISLNAAEGKPQQKRSISPIRFASLSVNNEMDDDSWDYMHHESYEVDKDLNGQHHDLGDNPNRVVQNGLSYPQFNNPEALYHPPPHIVPSRLSISSPPPVPGYESANYTLLSFSTLQILEDRYSVSWYNIRPHELLELHPLGTVIRLPRNISMGYVDSPDSLATKAPSSDAFSSLSEYIQPYFQACVKVLRFSKQDTRSASQSSSPTQEIFGSSHFGSHSKASRILKPIRRSYSRDFDLSTAGEIPTIDPYIFPSDSPSVKKSIGTAASSHKVPAVQQQSAKRRGVSRPDGSRIKMTWQDSWVVIREGMLSLCEKKEDTRNPLDGLHLSSLLVLRGVEQLMSNPLYSSLLGGSNRRHDANTKNYIVCAKFQLQKDQESGTSIGEKDSGAFDRVGRKSYHIQGLDHSAPNINSSSSDASSGGSGKDDSVWLVIDMLNEIAFNNISRVLHRLAPHHIGSSLAGGIPHHSSSNPFWTVTDPSEFGDFSIKQKSSFQSMGTSMSPPSPRSPLSIDTSNITLRSSFERQGAYKSSYESVRKVFKPKYPEWRFDATMRAKRVGLGGVVKGMQVLLCGDTWSDDEQDVNEELDTAVNQSTMSKTPEEPWKLDTAKIFKPDSTYERIRKEDDPADEDSETASWDHSYNERGWGEKDSSENEWEGWEQDLQRQRILLAQKRKPDSSSSSSVQQVHFSDYGIENDQNGSVRRRVYSDAQWLVQPPSLMMAESPVDDDSVFWTPWRMPGGVTTSTVTAGNPSPRRRSTTVIGSFSPSLLKEPKDKTTNREKKKVNSEGPPWKSRPPSLYIPPHVSKPPETSSEPLIASPAGSRRGSSPSLFFSRGNAAGPVDSDPGSSSNPDHVLAPSSLTSEAQASSSVIRTKSKSKVSTLNGIVRGVSVRASAVKARAKGVL